MKVRQDIPLIQAVNEYYEEKWKRRNAERAFKEDYCKKDRCLECPRAECREK